MISQVIVELNSKEDGNLELVCKSKCKISAHVSKAFDLFNSANHIKIDHQRALIESEFLEKLNKQSMQSNKEKQELNDLIYSLRKEIDKARLEENEKRSTEVHDLMSKQAILINEYESKLKSMNENISQEASLRSKQFECDLRLEISELRSQLQIANLKLTNSSAVESIVNHIDKNYENINRFFASSNEELGNSGEEFVFNVIQQSIYLTEKSYVENVSGVSDSCDLFVKHNECMTAIEVKNHAAAIKKDLIKRFIEKDMRNENYNSGIFVSLKSGFCLSSGISHFEIRFINGKPCIFIANAFKKKDHIVLAIKMIDYLISNQNKDKDFIHHVIQTVNAMMYRLDSMVKNNNTMLKSIRESNSTIDELRRDIDQILGKKTYKHTCECGKGFDRKVEYNKCMKSHD